LILLYVVYKSRELELRQLPKEVSWSYLDQKRRFWEWDYQGTSKTGFYSKVLEKGTEGFKRVHDLFYDTVINGGKLQIDQVTAVYNPGLTSSFITQWKVISDRLRSGHLFNNKEATQRELREFVEKHFEELLTSFHYDKNSGVPILPVCHGTDHYIAEKIAQTGFATLSTIDAGYYGRGIYFSTYAQYTFPYFMQRDNPCVVISYIIPGNPYPVVEHHLKKNNLVGQGLKPGFNSHYALTNKDGFIVTQSDDLEKELIFNEFVINQESQIVPAFIVDLDTTNFPQFAEEWRRQVVSKRDRVPTTSTSTLGQHVDLSTTTLNMNVI